MIKVLFVCTGNICRSPTAEAVFRALAAGDGLDGRFLVESAGTDAYHVGQKPDARAIRVAGKNGVMLGGKARALSESDYFDFDYIFAMDGGHMHELNSRMPEKARAKIQMFLFPATHLRENEVPDPWYGDENDFENVYKLVYEGSRAILNKIKEDHRL